MLEDAVKTELLYKGAMSEGQYLRSFLGGVAPKYSSKKELLLAAYLKKVWQYMSVDLADSELTKIVMEEFTEQEIDDALLPKFMDIYQADQSLYLDLNQGELDPLPKNEMYHQLRSALFLAIKNKDVKKSFKALKALDDFKKHKLYYRKLVGREKYYNSYINQLPPE